MSNENNESSMTYAKVGLLVTLKKNMEADQAFRDDLRDHNQRLAQKAADELIDHVGKESRRMFENFSTANKQREGQKLVAYKDVRKTRYSQKQWTDEIARITLSDQTSIAHGELKYPNMVLSVPEFNVDHTDFVRVEYVCEASLKFIKA